MASVEWVSGLLPVVKWPRSEADHSPLFSAKIKDEWSYTSTAKYATGNKFALL